MPVRHSKQQRYDLCECDLATEDCVSIIINFTQDSIVDFFVFLIWTLTSLFQDMAVFFSFFGCIVEPNLEKCSKSLPMGSAG